MSTDLASFLDYEREFISVSSQLPLRINTVQQSTNETEATAELKRIETDLAQARQRVSGGC